VQTVNVQCLALLAAGAAAQAGGVWTVQHRNPSPVPALK